MADPDIKNLFLGPVRAFTELVRGLSSAPYPGAPSSWTLEMTALVVALAFVVPVLHLFDADIVKTASQSSNVMMEILRTVTDAIRTLVWLAVALVVWFVTAFLLVPLRQGGLSEVFTRLHGWATLVLVSIVIGSIPLELGKWAVGRARPFLLEELGAFSFFPFKGEFLYESFPSGHSMMAGIMMASLWMFLPRLRILTVAVCVLFCISRLAAGAHFPTDILVGVTVGFMSAWWTARFMATRNIIFSLKGDRAFPTP